MKSNINPKKNSKKKEFNENSDRERKANDGYSESYLSAGLTLFNLLRHKLSELPRENIVATIRLATVRRF